MNKCKFLNSSRLTVVLGMSDRAVSFMCAFVSGFQEKLSTPQWQWAEPQAVYPEEPCRASLPVWEEPGAGPLDSPGTN